jgi:hypothetical protein
MSWRNERVKVDVFGLCLGGFRSRVGQERLKKGEHEP